MEELTADRFYRVLKGYEACCIDFVLARDGRPYRGQASHREALAFAMERCAAFEPCSFEIGKAKAVRIGASELLAFPETPWKHGRHGTMLYDEVKVNGKIPYWYAFVQPPHGSGPVVRDGRVIRDCYGREDFQIINDALFPRGTERLMVYDWSTDWSDYFDDGHEWWGTGCWSVYDDKMDRYAVILVSATD